MAGRRKGNFYTRHESKEGRAGEGSRNSMCKGPVASGKKGHVVGTW